MTIYYRQDGAPGGGAPAGGGNNAPGTPPGGVLVPLDQQHAAARLAALEQENNTLKARNTQIEQQFRDGSKKLEELHSTIVSPEYLQFIASRGKGGAAPAGGGGAPAGGTQAPTADELNSMDNSELIAYIQTTLRKVVQEAVGPVAAKTEEGEVRAQVQSLANQFPDYWQYRGAMMQIAERNKTLDPTTVYLMVKGLETSTGKSYKDPPPAEGGTGEGRNAPFQRGANRPASGEVGSGPSGSLGTNREQEPTSYAEAAGSAYDAIFGRG